MTAIPAGPHTLRLSHPDKILFPEQGDTKQDLADYYFKIAPAMLPYLKDRPLSLQRFPGGIGEAGFYQKEIPETYPQWIQRARIPKREGGAQNQLLCQNAETLLYLVNQNCITPHAWLSRYPALERPDRLILDFDPPNSDTPAAQAGACRLHALLESRGIPHYAMSTGSRGFHVIIPLDGQADFDSRSATPWKRANRRAVIGFSSIFFGTATRKPACRRLPFGPSPAHRWPCRFHGARCLTAPSSRVSIQSIPFSTA
jgi:bifunctional non-homologous end joining protein LigD